MNKLLNAVKSDSIYTYTENGGLTYNTTQNALEDLFGLGGSYRSRTDEDCILLFKKAYAEDATLAMKCLFYIRDREAGLGERRFFKVIIKWLAINHTAHMEKNLQYIPLYGRYDDWYAFVDTPLETKMFNEMRKQLALDVDSKTPSLLAKWMKSINSSSKETCALGAKTAKALGMTAKQYRKTLSILRARINVLEKLMSENRWDEIEFDKIPSRAGFIYRNAFARHDVERTKAGVHTYEDFAKDSETKVNADNLYPCDIVKKATYEHSSYNSTTRCMINKYWDNLKDYFQKAVFNGVVVVDTSASMRGYSSEIAPIDVAISLGMYCAKKCSPNSPFYGHYISFSRTAKLIPVDGIDFVDKVQRIYNKNLCENTNIFSVFKLILQTAVNNYLTQEDMPKNIVIISDMEFDACSYNHSKTVMENIVNDFHRAGYELPHLIYWNVDARQDNIPMRSQNGITFVSGYSPVIFEMLLSGKTSRELILDKLNSDRYKFIH